MRLEDILRMFEGDCSSRLFWISTWDGKPHLAPVCFVRVMDGKIVVAYNFIKKTSRNVEKTGNAAIGFAERGEEGFFGYMVKGRAWTDYEGEYYREIKEFVERASGGKRTPVGALVIEPDEVYSLKPGNERKRII